MVSSTEIDALYERWLATPEEDRYSFVMGSLPEPQAMALLRYMTDLRARQVNYDEESN